MSFVLATSRPWYEPMAQRLQERLDEPVVLITRKAELTAERLRQIDPVYVLFPHWSHIIKPAVYENFECIIFHMTDVPFGRGGSPLQNLISRRIYETKLSALRCVRDLDAGPVYLKRPLSLTGSATEIFESASELIEEMIVEIIKTRPEPVEQTGEPTVFKRRRPEQSNVEEVDTLDDLYDHIRMLDADGYPHAFLEAGGFRLEFRQAHKGEHSLTAQVTITEVDHE